MFWHFNLWQGKRTCVPCMCACLCALTPCRAVNFISNSFGRIKCLHKINIQVEPQDKTTTTTTTATSCSSSTDSTDRAGAATVIVTVIPTATTTTMLMANQMKHNIKLIVRAENKTKDLGNKLDSTRLANWNVLFWLTNGARIANWSAVDNVDNLVTVRHAHIGVAYPPPPLSMCWHNAHALSNADAGGWWCNRATCSNSSVPHCCCWLLMWLL